jgi:hypothetical protein
MVAAIHERHPHARFCGIIDARERPVRSSVYVFAVERGCTSYAWVADDGTVNVSTEFPSLR